MPWSQFRRCFFGIECCWRLVDLAFEIVISHVLNIQFKDVQRCSKRLSQIRFAMLCNIVTMRRWSLCALLLPCMIWSCKFWATRTWQSSNECEIDNYRRIWISFLVFLNIFNEHQWAWCQAPKSVHRLEAIVVRKKCGDNTVKGCFWEVLGP